MICVKDLYKSFDGHTVLKGLHMNVKKGSIYGLLGKNGAGKTTLIHHLASVYRPDQGTVEINGRDAWENPAVKQSVRCVFDDPYFYPAYSLKSMARFYKVFYPAWNQDRYNSLVAEFGLNESQKLARLSKGMKRQAAFLLAICSMPEYLILDEPVDGLDPIIRKKVWSLIVDDVAEREMTVLASSHNLRELEGICDCVGLLKDGRLLAEADLDDMKNRIHKIQLGFTSSPPNLPASWDVVHRQAHGNAFMLVVRGERAQLQTEAAALQPAMLEIFPLSLEEIFLYEMEGGSNDVQ